MKDYGDTRSLEREVTDILLFAAGRAQAAGPARATGTQARPAEVWATPDKEVEQRPDSKGRLKTHRRDYLVLTNRGDVPAYEVSFELEPEADGATVRVIDADRPIEVLPPGAPMKFSVLVHMTPSVRCTVRWYDEPAEEGVEREVREQVSTVRF